MILPLPIDIFRPFLERRPANAAEPDSHPAGDAGRSTRPTGSRRSAAGSADRARGAGRGLGRRVAGAARHVRSARAARSGRRPRLYVGSPCRRRRTRPGGEVRVVPNKYPALSGSLGRHEVVSIRRGMRPRSAELSADELEDVATAWRPGPTAPGRGLRLRPCLRQRRAAGRREHSPTRTHSSSGCGEPARRARGVGRAGERCRLCEVIAEERAAGTRVVLEREGLTVYSPYAARVPYELVVAPLACEADGLVSARLPQALALLGEAVAALRALEGPVPLNAWLIPRPSTASVATGTSSSYRA